MSRTALRPALLAGIVAIAAACAASAPIAPAFAQGHGGEETEELSNNLSFPVIWSDGAALTLPGEFGKPELTDPATWTVEGEPTQVYEQATEGNVWQAQSEVALTPVEVSEIDWGDNLEARSLSLGKPVRVETTLLKNLETPMLAFQMVSNGGERMEEEFATTGDTEESPQATVYSSCARLTIQRLLLSREDPYVSQLKWDPAKGEWVGSGLIAAPIFDGGVWESAGEGTGFSSEVNKAGRVIYGYNWRTSGLEAGDYRITFSLDPTCPTATLNTYITSATKVLFSEEEEGAEEGGGGSGHGGGGAAARATSGGGATALASSGGAGSGSAGGPGGSGAAGGGVPQIDAANNLSYVDVQLGNPTYQPYVPPAPEQEQKQTTTSTSAATTLTTTTQTKSQAKEQTRRRLHVTATLHMQKLKASRHRFAYRLYGYVSPPRDGQKLRVQLRTKHGWHTVAIVRMREQSKTRSSYSVTLRNPRQGIYRVMMVPNDKHWKGVSHTVRLG